LVFAALGEEFDAGGEGAEEVFELFGVFGGYVEGAHDAEELVRGGDAGLVRAVAGIGLRGVFVVAGLGGGFAFFCAGVRAVGKADDFAAQALYGSFKRQARAGGGFEKT